MGRISLKIAGAMCGLSMAIAVGSLSNAAQAFTETKVPPPATQAAPESNPSPLQLGKPEDGAGLSLSAPGISQSGGTELTIPGIGTVGSLPKLDFGLELLYGAGSGQTSDQPQENQNDDVMIKGTIKHRF